MQKYKTENVKFSSLTTTCFSFKFGPRIMQKRTRRRVFIPDVRNHGLSPHSESHTYFDVASDLRRLCADRGLGDVTLVAHSMGARAAMLLSLLGAVTMTYLQFSNE